MKFIEYTAREYKKQQENESDKQVSPILSQSMMTTEETEE